MTSKIDLDWLLDNFAQETPGVHHAATLSADGMFLAGSSQMSEVQREQFAAITSGLASLTDSAAETFDLMPVVRQVIETAHGWILISRVSDRAALGVVCAHDAELGLVGYEMALLAERAGQMLSPEVVAHLKNSLTI